MQIVIDIPNEYCTDNIVNELDCLLTDYFGGTICKTTPLPKGHGRLGDLDALKENMENGIRAGLLEEGYERYTNILDMDDCVECVEFADTIIPADKEKRCR